jgi:hypothetical protein
MSAANILGLKYGIFLGGAHVLDFVVDEFTKLLENGMLSATQFALPAPPLLQVKEDGFLFNVEADYGFLDGIMNDEEE